MAISISDLQVIEDSIHLVKGPNGNTAILIPTCSAIKYSNGVTLQALLSEILARLDNLENGQTLTWNGIPQNNN